MNFVILNDAPRNYTEWDGIFSSASYDQKQMVCEPRAPSSEQRIAFAKKSRLNIEILQRMEELLRRILPQSQRVNNRIVLGDITVYLRTEILPPLNYVSAVPGTWTHYSSNCFSPSPNSGRNIVELCQYIWHFSEEQTLYNLACHLGIEDKSWQDPYPKGEWRWEKEPLPNPFMRPLPTGAGDEVKYYSCKTGQQILAAKKTRRPTGHEYSYFSRWGRDSETGPDAHWVEALPPGELPLFGGGPSPEGSSRPVRMVPSEFDSRFQNFGSREIYCAIPGGVANLPRTDLSALAGHRVHLELLRDELAYTPGVIDALARSHAAEVMVSLIGELEAFPLDQLREVADRHGHSLPLPALPEPIMLTTALLTAGSPVPPSKNPRQMLLAPVISEGGLVWFYAREKVGKTLLALTIAQTVSRGGSLGPWQASEPASVLYIDGEMDPDDLQTAVAKVTRGQGNHTTVSFDVLCAKTTKHGVINLTDPEWQKEIELRAKGMRLVIFDNFYSLTNNNVGEFPEVLDFLQRLRAGGKAVVVVDHANREGMLQGAHTKERAAETVIEMRVPEGRSWRENVRAIEVTKARHYIPQAADHFFGEMVFTEESFHFEVSYPEAPTAPEPVPDQIAKLAYIVIARDIDALSFAKIYERLRIPRSTASDWYKRAKDLTGPEKEVLDREIQRLLEERKGTE